MKFLKEDRKGTIDFSLAAGKKYTSLNNLKITITTMNCYYNRITEEAEWDLSGHVYVINKDDAYASFRDMTWAGLDAFKYLYESYTPEEFNEDYKNNNYKIDFKKRMK